MDVDAIGDFLGQNEGNGPQHEVGCLCCATALDQMTGGMFGTRSKYGKLDGALMSAMNSTNKTKINELNASAKTTDVSGSDVKSKRILNSVTGKSSVSSPIEQSSSTTTDNSKPIAGSVESKKAEAIESVANS
mmetsp:Transcript_11127/g.15511  ORF Transcript_11127/g.15511 Transcript_11127/m.15511 type:complete len:133 (-) Transcript_11127:144-542(-)